MKLKEGNKVRLLKSSEWYCNMDSYQPGSNNPINIDGIITHINTTSGLLPIKVDWKMEEPMGIMKRI